MFFKYKHPILNRVMSGVLAILLVMLSVINPINMVPTYATGDRFGVTYHQNKDEAVDITIISENDSFESEAEISLKLYIRNNSEETLYDGALSFRDRKDIFTDAEFVLSDETEGHISEKGVLTGISLAPGEVIEAEFVGTVEDNAKLDGKRTLEFFFGAKDADENAVTRKVIFDYVTGYVTFLPVEFADGNEFAAGESGTMTFRISLDQSSHVFEDDAYTLATNSDANVMTGSDADVMTGSDADVMTDSDADVLTDSDAYLATDSDADEDEDRKKVSISEINFAIETTDMEFENVKLIDAKLIQTLNGTCEAEAIVSYTVGAENEVGVHYGNVKASVEIGKKTYKLYQGFELEVTGFTAEELESVQNVKDLIAKLPTMEEYLAAMDKFFPEDGTEDEEGYEAYIRELTKLAVPAFEAYEALRDALKALIDPADVEKLYFIYGMCDPTTLEGESSNFGNNYIALRWNGSNNSTLRIYCKGLVGSEEIDLLANATNTDGLVGELILNATLNNADNTSSSEIATEIVKDFKDVLSGIHTNAYYELQSYAKSTIWDYKKGTWINNVNLVSYHNDHPSNAPEDWHYTTGNSTNNWQTVGNSNGQEAELTIYYNVKKVERLTPITNNTKLNATVQMFDYHVGGDSKGGINKEGIRVPDYYFYTYETSQDQKSQQKDGFGSFSTEQKSKYKDNVPMDSMLNPNGYPVIKDGNKSYNLDYLFNDTVFDGKVVYDEMNDGGGLFQLGSDGYYVYDSAKNAAYYDGTGFTLYQNVLRPSHTNASNGLNTNNEDGRTQYRVRESNFLPFNEPWVDTSKRTEHSYNGEAVYSYPLDNYSGSGILNKELDTRVDYWFGMTLEFEFMMPKDGKVNGQDMIFEFDGDDDVWVYIDDKLVLDIGACHENREGTINFAEGTVSDPTTGNSTKSLSSIFGNACVANSVGEVTFKDYTVHKLKFFYLERGGSYSYCKIRFNLPTLPNESLTVEKELIDGNTTDAEVRKYIKDTLEYQFRVVDENGDLYIPATSSNASGTYRTTYTLIEEGKADVVKELNSDGSFFLKAGQKAQFKDMFQYDKNENILNVVDTYYVQEILPSNLVGQYNGMGFVVNGAGGEVDYKEAVEADGKTSFKTAAILNNETHYVLYRNKVDLSKLGILEIEKVQPEGSKLSLNQEFKINVKLGSETLEDIPVGTEYLVKQTGNSNDSGTTKKVDEEGYIKLKIGETATLVEGILAGTKYLISEDMTRPNGVSFVASYSGTVNDETINVPSEATGVNGSIKPGDKVHIVVSNADYDFKTEIPLTKTTVNFQSGDPDTFTFVATPCDATGKILPESTLTPVTTTVKVTDTTAESDSATDKLIFGYRSDVPVGIYYYLVSEVLGTETDIDYDDSKYLIMVSVVDNAGVKSATSTVVGKVSGENIENATSIEFVNKKIIKLTVTKVIENYTDALKDTKFTFNVKVNDEESISISLGHNDSKTMDISYGSNVTVSEINHDGYLVTYVIGSDGNVVVGDSTSFENLVADTSITFTNRPGAVLPTTGGNGTLPYRMNGLLMMLMAAGYLLISEKKLRRKEEE